MELASSININVESQYMDEQSSPANDRYAFAYTITISNKGNEPVQLLTRHWLITDGNNNVQEVRGEGVVGEQPIINPGSSYRYSSGALLDTAVGTMEGSYHMQSQSGQQFDAPIAPFPLIRPGAVH